MLSPAALGLPSKFQSWRKGQEKAVQEILFSKERFSILNSPVGAGKSLTGMALAMVDEEAVLTYLTSTRALQDQVLGEFESCGLTDIRGRANYSCNIEESKTAAEAKCTAGYFCDRRKDEVQGCDYYDQKRDAAAARLRISNYSFWLHDEESGALGPTDILVLDEAHNAPTEIERFAAVELSEHDLTSFRIPTPDRATEKGGTSRERWRMVALHQIEEGLAALKVEIAGQVRVDTHLLARVRTAKDIQRKLVRMCRLGDHEWLFSISPSRKFRKWKWELLNPGALAEDLLFRGAKKIVLVSATVNRKTLDLLGVKDQSRIRLIEQDSTFPVRRRPIYYWPVARVGFGMDGLQTRRWREAIDEIVSARLDRKGVIHSVSYARALEIARQSKFRDEGIFIIDTQDRQLQDVLREFRSRPAPCVLISPRSWKGSTSPCGRREYQIIAKMPFPDMRDPLITAKKKRDKDYIPYVVLQHVVQMVGRIVRSIEDQGETFVIDDHFGWLKAGYFKYNPRWFSVAIKTIAKRERAPLPPPRLAA
jgi:Rad3-related DNA helicase